MLLHDPHPFCKGGSLFAYSLRDSENGEIRPRGSPCSSMQSSGLALSAKAEAPQPLHAGCPILRVLCQRRVCANLDLAARGLRISTRANRRCAHQEPIGSGKSAWRMFSEASAQFRAVTGNPDGAPVRSPGQHDQRGATTGRQRENFERGGRISARLKR